MKAYITLLISVLLLSIANSQDFNDYFVKLIETKLETDKLVIGKLRNFAVDNNDNYIFVDLLGKQVLIFKSDGKYYRQLGREGEGAGEYRQPVCVAIDVKGNLYLSDNELRRISKYSSSYSFIKSFIIELTHYVPDYMKIIDDKIYMDAYKEDFKRPGCGDNIVVYSVDGKYLKSFYPIMQWTCKSNLGYFSNCSFDIGTDGNIYAIQSAEYVINIMDKDGNIKTSFGKKPDYHKAPKPIDDLKKFFQQKREEIDKFHYSFTTVEKLILSDNGYILISIRIPEKISSDKFSYRIEIYDTKGKHIVGGISTNYQLLCKDKENNFYFLTYYEERDPHPPIYKIGKYKLKLK